MGNPVVNKNSTRSSGPALRTRTAAQPAGGRTAAPKEKGAKPERGLVDRMKNQVRQAQDGDPEAIRRLEELAKQNQELFKRFQALMNGQGPNPGPSPAPNPGPDNPGPQPAPNPAPAPGPGPGPGPEPAPAPGPAPGPAPSGGCANCGGANQGAAGEGIGNQLMELLMMILQLLQQKDGGDENPDAAGADPLTALSRMLGMDPQQLQQMLMTDPMQALQAISEQTGLDLSPLMSQRGPAT